MALYLSIILIAFNSFVLAWFRIMKNIIKNKWNMTDTQEKLWQLTKNIFAKEATKSFFMRYLSVVIILFNACLCKSWFSTYSWKNYFFIFLCSFFICSVLNLMWSSKIFCNICVIIVYKDITSALWFSSHQSFQKSMN